MGGLLALRVSPVSQAVSLPCPFLLPVARSYTHSEVLVQPAGTRPLPSSL